MDTPGPSAEGDQDLNLVVDASEIIEQMKQNKSFDNLRLKILHNIHSNVRHYPHPRHPIASPISPDRSWPNLSPNPPPLQEALVQIIDDIVCNTNAAKSGNLGRINDEIRSNKTLEELSPHVFEALWQEMSRPELSADYVDIEVLKTMQAMEDEIAADLITPPIKTLPAVDKQEELQ